MEIGHRGIKTSIILCAVVVSVFGICKLVATTIDIFRVTYSLTSLRDVTSDEIKAEYNYQKLQNTPTFVGSSAQTGTYLQVEIRKVGFLGFLSTVKTVKFNDPEQGVTVNKGPYNIGSAGDNFKYKLYDYSIERLEGILDVQIGSDGNY